MIRNIFFEWIRLARSAACPHQQIRSQSLHVEILQQKKNMTMVMIYIYKMVIDDHDDGGNPGLAL